MGLYIVTGGAGFIGSHVVDAINARGDQSIVIDDLSTGRQENLSDPTQLITVDIARAIDLEKATANIQRADGIVHCAAQASVIVSLADPARDRAVNLDGTKHVLALAERLGVPMVLTSTAAVYGLNAPLPTPEGAVIAPASPYASSKVGAEAAVNEHSASTGLPHAVCRLANVYGPRQRGDGEAGVVAVIAKRLQNGEKITLYGSGDPTRDFIHVDDVAQALLLALGSGVTCNIGTGMAVSVRHVYDLSVAAVPSQTGEPLLAELRSGEIMHSRLDPTRAYEALGWRSSITADEGVPETVSSLVAADSDS